MCIIWCGPSFSPRFLGFFYILTNKRTFYFSTTLIYSSTIQVYIGDSARCARSTITFATNVARCSNLRLESRITWDMSTTASHTNLLSLLLNRIEITRSWSALLSIHLEIVSILTCYTVNKRRLVRVCVCIQCSVDVFSLFCAGWIALLQVPPNFMWIFLRYWLMHSTRDPSNPSFINFGREIFAPKSIKVC